MFLIILRILSDWLLLQNMLSFILFYWKKENFKIGSLVIYLNQAYSPIGYLEIYDQ
jgi:hypothetical protein